MTSIPLILSGEHPCSYLKGKLAQSLFVHPACELTPSIYAQLLSQGFRRSGDHVYLPHCFRCFSCVPARVPVAWFRPDRSQKRCRKKNANTAVAVKPAVYDDAHYAMYLRYQNFKHEHGDMAHASPDEYISFLGSSWCDTRFAEFSIDDELAAVAVIDQFEHAWSAVYTFYEPKFSGFSPGMYAILWQIDEACRQQKEYLYLGYWIKDCRKMTYKSHYRPLQLLIDGKWVGPSSAG